MDYISPKQSALKVKQWAKNTIAAGRRHSVGLKFNRTVTAVGDNNYGTVQDSEEKMDICSKRDLMIRYVKFLRHNLQ